MKGFIGMVLGLVFLSSCSKTSFNQFVTSDKTFEKPSLETFNVVLAQNQNDQIKELLVNSLISKGGILDNQRPDYLVFYKIYDSKVALKDLETFYDGNVEQIRATRKVTKGKSFLIQIMDAKTNKTFYRSIITGLPNSLSSTQFAHITEKSFKDFHIMNQGVFTNSVSYSIK